MSGAHLSRELFALIKQIGECRSKQEEDRIMEAEARTLRRRICEPGTKNLRELVIRALYLHMLGHDASFAVIEGVNAASDKSFMVKRTGYVFSSSYLVPSSELMILLVGTIQRDLSSANQLEAAAGLTVACRCMNGEIMPALRSTVRRLTESQHELVRKHAYLCVQRMVSLSVESLSEGTWLDASDLEDFQKLIRKGLSDSAPSVMAAALNLLDEFVTGAQNGNYGSAHSGLPPSVAALLGDVLPSLGVILRQVVERKLPKDCDYHRVPAPWTQLSLLRLIRRVSVVLARGKGPLDGKDPRLVGVADSVLESLRQADAGSTIGAALTIEAVGTVCCLPPNLALRELCLGLLARLLASDSHNMRYAGIKGLTKIAALDPRYVLDHQLAVAQCLEDADETLKVATFNLLFAMANGDNICVIFDKFLTHVGASGVAAVSRGACTALTKKLVAAAQACAPSEQWYFGAVLSLLGSVPNSVPMDAVFAASRLVAESEADSGLKGFAANYCIDLLDAAAANFAASASKNESFQLNSALLGTCLWLVGEYGKEISSEHQNSLTGSMLSNSSNQNGFETRSMRDIIDLLLEILRGLSARNSASSALGSEFRLDGVNGLMKKNAPEVSNESAGSSSSDQGTVASSKGLQALAVGSILKNLKYLHVSDRKSVLGEVERVVAGQSEAGGQSLLISDEMSGLFLSVSRASQGSFEKVFPYDASSEEFTEEDLNLDFCREYIEASRRKREAEAGRSAIHGSLSHEDDLLPGHNLPGHSNQSHKAGVGKVDSEKLRFEAYAPQVAPARTLPSRFSSAGVDSHKAAGSTQPGQATHSGQATISGHAGQVGKAAPSFQRGPVASAPAAPKNPGGQWGKSGFVSKNQTEKPVASADHGSSEIADSHLKGESESRINQSHKTSSPEKSTGHSQGSRFTPFEPVNLGPTREELAQAKYKQVASALFSGVGSSSTVPGQSAVPGQSGVHGQSAVPKPPTAVPRQAAHKPWVKQTAAPGSNEHTPAPIPASASNTNEEPQSSDKTHEGNLLDM